MAKSISLSPMKSAASSTGLTSGLDLVNRGVLLIDRLLRHHAAIYQFASASECLLRAARGTAMRDLRLGDGTLVQIGDPILELHLWNDNMPRIPSGGPTLAWARCFRRCFELSFALLADHVAQDLPEIRAVTARCPFIVWGDRPQLARLAATCGLELLDDVPDPGRMQQFHDICENVYIMGLLRCFNPRAHWHALLDRERYQLWISRDRLIAVHGKGH